MAPSLSHVLLVVVVFYYMYRTEGLDIARYSQFPVQYHIQADTGGDRYFRYQTYNGQWRKEKRLRNGKVIGAYGWTDNKGILRLYDYLADEHGYRVVRERNIKVADEAPSGEGPGGVDIAQNKIRSSSLNSLRKSNFDKVRKRSHVTVPSSTSSTNSDDKQIIPIRRQDSSDLNSIQDDAFGDELRRALGKVNNKHDQLENQHVTNGFDDQVLTYPTNEIESLNSIGKSITDKDSSSKDPTMRDILVKKNILKNGRLLMRGKKLRLFDKTYNETNNDTEINNEMPHSSDVTDNAIHKTGMIQNSDSTDGKTTDLDVRIESTRPKLSMSRLLRAKQKGVTKHVIPVAVDITRNSVSVGRRLNLNAARAQNTNLRNTDPPNVKPILTNPNNPPTLTKARNHVFVPNQPFVPLASNLSPVLVDAPTKFPTHLTENVYVRRKRKPSATFPVIDTQGVEGSKKTVDFDTGNQFHFEVTKTDGSRVGRHGYVDPMGFLRIANYVSDSSGHNEKRSSQFVGSRQIGEGNYRI